MTVTRAASAPAAGLDVARIRLDFPILETVVHGHPLVYLDNAATSQTPEAVIEAMADYYRHDNANIHRGVHALSERATNAYEGVREAAARFLGAGLPGEIVFTRGTTESINLVAGSWGSSNVETGDVILVSAMEHHSNMVPWQLLAERKGALIRVIPVTDEGDLDLAEYEELLKGPVKVVAVAHVSNVLGTVNPIRRMTDLAHKAGAVVVVDGAQSAPHMSVDVTALDCDFYACSAHKMLGPTGVGILYGKAALLDRMPPWQSGGGMIASVRYERSTWAPAPERFEAGTPPIAEVVGLGAAINYMNRIGLEAIAAHEEKLLRRATDAVAQIDGLRIIGTAEEKVSVLSFVMDCAHPHDIGTILDQHGIAVRAGHHCAQPLMERFGVPATARASFSVYNTEDEVHALVLGLHQVKQVFG